MKKLLVGMMLGAMVAPAFVFGAYTPTEGSLQDVQDLSNWTFTWNEAEKKGTATYTLKGTSVFGPETVSGTFTESIAFAKFNGAGVIAGLGNGGITTVNDASAYTLTSFSIRTVNNPYKVIFAQAGQPNFENPATKVVFVDEENQNLTIAINDATVTTHALTPIGDREWIKGSDMDAEQIAAGEVYPNGGYLYSTGDGNFSYEAFDVTKEVTDLDVVKGDDTATLRSTYSGLKVAMTGGDSVNYPPSVYFETEQDSYLTYTFGLVPEPMTAALLGLGVAALLFRRKRNA